MVLSTLPEARTQKPGNEVDADASDDMVPTAKSLRKSTQSRCIIFKSEGRETENRNATHFINVVDHVVDDIKIPMVLPIRELNLAT